MTTKAKALAVAKKLGFVLDEDNSGPMPEIGYNATFDHPTHSLGGDCRSINSHSYGTVGSTASSQVWRDCIEEMQVNAEWLEPCTDPDCDYHFWDGEE